MNNQVEQMMQAFDEENDKSSTGFDSDDFKAGFKGINKKRRRSKIPQSESVKSLDFNEIENILLENTKDQENLSSFLDSNNTNNKSSRNSLLSSRKTNKIMPNQSKPIIVNKEDTAVVVNRSTILQDEKKDDEPNLLSLFDIALASQKKSSGDILL